METYKDIRETLKTDSVYLQNTSESCVLKLLPGPSAKTFIKFNGEKEREIDSDSELVYNTCMECDVITEKEYNEFG